MPPPRETLININHALIAINVPASSYFNNKQANRDIPVYIPDIRSLFITARKVCHLLDPEGAESSAR